MERTNAPKIVLLVRLLTAIDEGAYCFEELKDRIAEADHRPSTRSLRRYLAVLADAGFPWYFDRSTNTYRFSSGYSLKRLGLNGNELYGLVALRAIGATLGGAIDPYVDEVTAKIVGSPKPGVSFVVHGSTGSDVRIRFAPAASGAAVAARIGSERAVEAQPDGSVEITYGVADPTEFARWVLGWGADAEAVAPPSFRDRMRMLTAEISAKYELPVTH